MSPERRPLSPPRAALQRASWALAEAQTALEAATAPVQRLGAVAVTLDAAKRKLEGLRSEDDRRLTAWIRDGEQGLRPAPRPETDDAASRVAALSRDAEAASTLLAGAERPTRPRWNACARPPSNATRRSPKRRSKPPKNTPAPGSTP